MPLEISEIGVRLAVGAASPTGGAGPAAPDGGAGSTLLTEAQVDAIVQKCVAQVIANLKAEQAR